MPLSAREREARSQRAKAQHRAGKLGQRAKDRKHAQRAEIATTAPISSPAALVQDLVREHEQELRAVVRSALTSGTMASRARAAEWLLRMALAGQRAEASELREQQEYKSREELLMILADKLTTGPASALIRAELEARSGSVIDSTAVELP